MYCQCNRCVVNHYPVVTIIVIRCVILVGVVIAVVMEREHVRVERKVCCSASSVKFKFHQNCDFRVHVVVL